MCLGSSASENKEREKREKKEREEAKESEGNLYGPGDKGKRVRVYARGERVNAAPAERQMGRRTRQSSRDNGRASERDRGGGGRLDRGLSHYVRPERAIGERKPHGRTDGPTGVPYTPLTYAPLRNSQDFSPSLPPLFCIAGNFFFLFVSLASPGDGGLVIELSRRRSRQRRPSEIREKEFDLLEWIVLHCAWMERFDGALDYADLDDESLMGNKENFLGGAGYVALTSLFDNTSLITDAAPNFCGLFHSQISRVFILCLLTVVSSNLFLRLTILMFFYLVKFFLCRKYCLNYKTLNLFYQ